MYIHERVFHAVALIGFACRMLGVVWTNTIELLESHWPVSGTHFPQQRLGNHDSSAEAIVDSRMKLQRVLDMERLADSVAMLERIAAEAISAFTSHV